MLEIDPGENSLSVPPPRLGTSEAGHRRAEGRVAGGGGLASMSPIVTVVTPGMERRRPTGRGLLAEPRGSRCRHVSRRVGAVPVGPPNRRGREEREQSRDPCT